VVLYLDLVQAVQLCLVQWLLLWLGRLPPNLCAEGRPYR
jgi:hypothetical protein